jgi:hypothetical protein
MAACLLFWGWQSDLVIVAAIMAVILESAHYVKARWDLSDTEVSRIWNFCALLGLGAVVLAFTNNEGPSSFSKLWENPNLQSGRLASVASSQAAVTLLRWLPFIFYFLALAQAFSSRSEFPLETISPFLRYRRKQFLKLRRPAPRIWYFNASWPYFIMCLFAASAHSAEEGHVFFWGLCVLVAWALWAQRPMGFALYLWLATFGIVIVCSLLGQHGFGRLSRLTDWADNYNAPWFNRWMHTRTDPEQSRTAIGHIGQLQMSSQIVLRVTPVNKVTVPTYLREATYRNYLEPNGPASPAIWNVGGGRNGFTAVSEIPANSGRWLLQSAPISPSFVHISCYLEDFNAKDGFNTGVLPLPMDCDHLEQCLAYTLQNNNVGTVLADGPGLMDFDADFGSGRIRDAPPAPNTPAHAVTNFIFNVTTKTATKMVTNVAASVSEDLGVPLQEKLALDTVISQLPLAGLTDAQKMTAVRHYFAANYEYSFWQGPQRNYATNTALSNFLLHTHRGHCEYFATATVLLLRELHIPARYAVGYVVHELAGNHYVVRERDAHAWCLAWDIRDHTWMTMDTTPASWIADEGKRVSSWQSISDFFSWLRFKFAQFRYGQGHLRPYLLLALVPTLGYFLYQILFHRRRHKPGEATKMAAPMNRPGLDSEFYLLEIALARRGLVRRPGESLAHWLRQVVADPAVAGQREPLSQLLRLHYQHRFDPSGLAPAERAELSRQAKTCLAKINGG